MYIIRDVFQLQFGRFKEARALMEEATKKGMLPDARSVRVLADFTGQAYRLILEAGYDHLADYEISLQNTMKGKEWQDWYEKFKPLVISSEREILRQVI